MAQVGDICTLYNCGTAKGYTPCYMVLTNFKKNRFEAIMLVSSTCGHNYTAGHVFPYNLKHEDLVVL